MKSGDLCNFTWNLKPSRIIIIIILSALIFAVPLITYYYFSNVESNPIQELFRIKVSVLSELRDMKIKKEKLQQELQSYTKSLEQLKFELSQQQTQLNWLEVAKKEALEVAKKEAREQNTPELALPKRLTANTLPEIFPLIPRNISRNCRMFSCFDHSRCSLTSGFPVYFYDPNHYTVTYNSSWAVDGFLKTTLKQSLGYNPHLTNDPKEACIYLVLVGEALKNTDNISDTFGNSDLLRLDFHSLKRLPFWGGDGRNHVLLNLARRDLSAASGDIFFNVDTGRAILVQSTFTRNLFRSNFDLIVSPVLGPPGGDVWEECAPMLPARRKYLLSFQIEIKHHKNNKQGGPSSTYGLDDSYFGNTENSFKLDAFIIEHLKEMEKSSTSDKFYFEFECMPANEDNLNTDFQDWVLCGTDSSRRSVLRDSTFVLVFSPATSKFVSTTLLQARIYEALRSGAIPVILGGDQVRLAYDEVIQWKRICLFLPKVRITELHFLLRTIPDVDLLAMRRQGRLIWEKYLASVQSTLDTIVAVLRDRLNIPPLPAKNVPAIPLFNDTFQPMQVIVNVDGELHGRLGPLEPPYNSPAYRRNYSLLLTQGHEIWNDWFDPFYLYPTLPTDPLLPSDAKFLGSGRDFRPIGKGQGGTGKEFSEALGGNNPREQFTVVLLTYKREKMLLDSIARLRGLPYLNSVVVVWNSPKPPSPELRWPYIQVPMHIVNTAGNSLNNRFLPLDNIKTEAVLSLDDDTHLCHDEIVFAFRVWREHRDRIVGCQGRYHSWNIKTAKSWLYRASLSCELSMVLTGAAFIHRHYFHLYWKWLPQAIRDKVDEYMNCEDIAMNFLVSHITRQPPIKVTSKWYNIHRPGGTRKLSGNFNHSQERDKCINFFTQVFGYTPLLNTQFRADSMLYNTNFEQKCFKSV